MMKKFLNIFLVAIFLVGSLAPFVLADDMPADTDGDGVDDFHDNCKYFSNLDQADIDADGFGDECDVDVVDYNEKLNSYVGMYHNHLITFEQASYKYENAILDKDSAKIDEAGLVLKTLQNELESHQKDIYFVIEQTVSQGELGFSLAGKFKLSHSNSLTLSSDVDNFLETTTYESLFGFDYEKAYVELESQFNDLKSGFDTTVVSEYQVAMCSGDEQAIEEVTSGIESEIQEISLIENQLYQYEAELVALGQEALAQKFADLADNFLNLLQDEETLIFATFDNSVCQVPVENDADGDGILDDVDNCLNTKNADQADSDNDGIGDVCDTGVDDTDGDGILDDVDNCVDTSNADQADADNDGVGNVCDSDYNLTNQELYDVYEAEYKGLDKDYDYYKDQYEDAIEDDDEDDIEKYEEKLEELDDDLKDLDDNVEGLIDDVEDEDDLDKDLLKDLDDLEEDIENLRNKIDNVLDGDDDEDYVFSSYVSSNTASNVQEPSVVIEDLDLSGIVQNQDSTSTNNSWDDVRYMVWLIAGIVVLVAVVLFFLALLLRR